MVVSALADIVQMKHMIKRKKDIMILAVIFCLALIAFTVNCFIFREQGAVYCEIYVDGKLTETVDLVEERSFTLEDRPNISFEVKDHRIAFTASDCPDQICVHAGYLGQVGQSAACLPNKTSIRICSSQVNPEQPDIVIGFISGKVGGFYEK